MTSHRRLVRNATVPLPVRSVEAMKKTRFSDECHSQPKYKDFESLSSPKQHTSLKLLKDIEKLTISDLELDSDDESLLPAPEFGSNEKLYNDLIPLNEKSVCPLTSKSKPLRTVLKKDSTPNTKEFLSYSLLPEYSCKKVMFADFPEVPSSFNGHSLYKKRKMWKNA